MIEDDEVYFFDTYAIIEILLDNDNYKRYTDKGVILTKLNLFELYYNVLKDFGDAKADEYSEKYYPFIADYGKEVIKGASKLKLQYKDRNLSMTDCIGYIIAKKLGIKFLTGDKEFENFDNVEFVK